MLASTLSQNVYVDQPYRKEEVSRRFWFYRFFAPDVLGEPFLIFFHDRTLLFWLGDAVAEAFVHDHFYGYAVVFERLAQFVGIGDGHAAIVFAVLDKIR